MAINSVDMTKALNNEAYAAQVIRSGKCSASQRGQLAAQWGSDKIAKWESVDSTQYEITDDQKQVAKSNGDKKVEEATNGFDGKADTAKSAATSSLGLVAGAAGAAFGIMTAVYSAAKDILCKIGSTVLAAIAGAVLLASSIALKALAPNKEQAQALDDLAPVMEEAQRDLEEQQGILSDTTNEIVDDTDDLIDASEKANKDTETKQKDYERLQQEYQRLVEKQEASKSGGEPLTEAEKSRFEYLGGVLGTVYEDLTQVKVDGDARVEDAKENLEEQQEVYDDAAMKIEEVQEITDFSAEFDEATVTNTKLVKAAAYVGEAGAAGVITSGILGWGKSIFHPDFWVAPVAVAEGVASAAVLTSVIKDQSGFQSRAEAGVENRVNTEDVNTSTSEVYEEELDNYASSIDLTDEIVIDETTASATQIVQLGDNPSQTGDGTGEPEVNPFAPPSSDGASDGVGGTGGDGSNPFGGDDDKKEKI